MGWKEKHPQHKPYRKEYRPVRWIYGPHGIRFKAPPGVVEVTVDGEGRQEQPIVFRQIDHERWKKAEAERLSREKRSSLYDIGNQLLHNLYDLSSGGLGHKLGLFVKLKDEELTDKDCTRLAENNPIGKSNFYASTFLRSTVKGERIDWYVPSWFFDHFNHEKKFRDVYKQTDVLADEAELSGMNRDFQTRDNFQRLAYLDVYYTYELANILFSWIDTKASGVIRSKHKPEDHINERNNAWKNSEILRPIRNYSTWSYKGQPTLGDLISTTYQVLVDYRTLAGSNFQEEITSPLHLL